MVRAVNISFLDWNLYVKAPGETYRSIKTHRRNISRKYCDF